MPAEEGAARDGGFKRGVGSETVCIPNLDLRARIKSMRPDHLRVLSSQSRCAVVAARDVFKYIDSIYDEG